ncbi:MAG: hypothetical protein KBC35_00775 [Candidatus Pacebacteria bacterium]|nr:hypothetical protein [Candidatus Paceibacterota bacterium]
MRPRPKRLDPNTIVLLKQIGIGVMAISVVALVLTGIWYGTRISSLTITEVEASGGETIDHTEVETLARGVLDGEYVGFVPRRFAWLYPEAEVYTKVSAIERIYNVTLSLESGTKLHITYDEYVPYALWCSSDGEESCVFVNDDGYAFAHAPKLSGGSFLRFVTTGREAVVGETLAENQILDTSRTLVRLLADQNWFISHVEIDQVGDVFLNIVGGGELKINTKESPERTIENLLVILASEEFKHLQPGNFQYVDLRFGEKVFVNEELLMADTDTIASTTSATSTEESE